MTTNNIHRKNVFSVTTTSKVQEKHKKLYASKW